MKKILITGANSYIGTSFENYMKQFADDYKIDTVDMIDGTWCEKDFSEYDSVFHVAGIAHQRETKENEHLYYRVNRDLVIETAKKAKRDGVKQFLFLSTMSVYGINTGIITKETHENPKSNYGRSKLEAEKEILKIADEKFKVCILRPPMVYGSRCKGNFQSVVNLVKKLPVFPDVKNQRSMIYIDNLSSFVKMCVDENIAGIYMPQNKEFVQTSYVAKKIAETLHKKIFISKLLGLTVLAVRPFVGYIQKAFGSLIYKDTEEFDFSYCVVTNEESFKKSL